MMMMMMMMMMMIKTSNYDVCNNFDYDDSDNDDDDAFYGGVCVGDDDFWLRICDIGDYDDYVHEDYFGSGDCVMMVIRMTMLVMMVMIKMPDYDYYIT